MSTGSAFFFFFYFAFAGPHYEVYHEASFCCIGGWLYFLFRKIFKGYSILYCMLNEKIIAYLKKDGGPCTQRDITGALPAMNRAVLLGYLRCLVDVGKIKSRDSGKAKIYYL